MPPHHGNFMICVGHRLQCKLANITNHKFPTTGVKYVCRYDVQRSGSKVTVATSD